MKREIIAALASALLLATAGTAFAQAGPEIPWWVLAGGGSEGGGGAVIINDTLGQPVIGPSTGGTIGLDAGYRQQIFGPAAVDDLAASVAAGPLLKLDWTAVTHDTAGHTIGGVTTNVYRAQDDPYFTPGTAYATGVTGTTWTDSADPSVLTNAGHGMYYVVKAVYAGLLSAASNRQGAFVFALTPGGQ